MRFQALDLRSGRIHKTDKYADTTGVANFSQEAREKYLIDMMKINFLKRLESSVFSFGATMNRTIAKIDALIR